MLLKIITHPALMLASMAIILVTNEKSAMLLAPIYILHLPHLTPFAVCMSMGLIILFFSYMVIKKETAGRTFHGMNALAIGLFITGIILFFMKAWESVYPTFEFFLPLTTVIFAAITLLASLMRNVYLLLKDRTILLA